MLKVLHLRVPLAKALQARALHLRVLHLRVLQAVLNLGPLVVDQVLLLGKAELLHLLEGLNQVVLAVEVKIHLIHPLAAVQALVDLNLEASQIPRIKVQAAIVVVQRKSLPMIAVQAQGEALTDPSSLIHFIGAGPITEEEVDFLLELC